MFITWPPPDSAWTGGAPSSDFSFLNGSNLGISGISGISNFGAWSGIFCNGSCPKSASASLILSSIKFKAPWIGAIINSLIGLRTKKLNSLVNAFTALIKPFINSTTLFSASTNGCSIFAGSFKTFSKNATAPPKRIFLKKSPNISNKPFTGLITFLLTSFTFDLPPPFSNFASFDFLFCFCSWLSASSSFFWPSKYCLFKVS